mmetsp:Transcript_28839/g.81344  ORF Transcript_28839/g.81344 Transcript_28839/m.81344 type:complete len:187 (-) Transcript_28839:560-1120(-)
MIVDKRNAFIHHQPSHKTQIAQTQTQTHTSLDTMIPNVIIVPCSPKHSSPPACCPYHDDDISDMFTPSEEFYGQVPSMDVAPKAVAMRNNQSSHHSRGARDAEKRNFLISSDRTRRTSSSGGDHRDSIPCHPRRSSIPRNSHSTHDTSYHSRDTPPALPARRRTVRLDPTAMASIVASMTISESPC